MYCLHEEHSLPRDLIHSKSVALAAGARGNEKSKTLKKRLAEMVAASEEMKFLVGFFYFSGIRELYDSLQAAPHCHLKVLVGLQAEKTLGTLVEYSSKAASDAVGAEQFFSSIRSAINTEEFDTEEFQEQVGFFLQTIRDERLIIRKTLDPCHAKLYIFNLKEEHKTLREKLFITGSSNLTRAGLVSQNEFNVEISDYGTEEAEEFFDKLWENAILITETDALKTKLLKLFEEETLISEITPFEAYALILKKYADLQQEKKLKQDVVDLLEKSEYRAYKYQLDAVRQAMAILEVQNGVIIADVVGLGKSVIASLVGKSLGERGLIICPPGLMGDKNHESGWRKYVEDFELHSWEVRSCGDLESVADFVQGKGNDCEVVVIDEAHRFRNQDSLNYEMLSRICRNRKVILLTATPFNNTPGDIFALLKLFTVPGKSTLTLTDDLDGRFTDYRNTFRRLSYIRKNWDAKEAEKRERAGKYHQNLFGEAEINLSRVEGRINSLSRQIRSVIEPVTIRRNRIDLERDPEYSQEIDELPSVEEPEEQFFELTVRQSDFYDKVIDEYFCEYGRFTGAVYQPYLYERGLKDADKLDEEGNRQYQRERNLFEFMRRLLVKRFESSFSAFEKSIERFLRFMRRVHKFVETSGKYVLDRDLVEKMFEYSEEDIEKELELFEQKIQEEGGDLTKRDQIYVLEDFKDAEQFKSDIKSDIALFKRIKSEISELELIANDPKSAELIKTLKTILKKESRKDGLRRKVIVFSEYVDTVKYLRQPLEAAFEGRVFTVPGELGKRKEKEMLHNFDAFAPANKQADDYDILLASDKISEGFDLNRAGAIVNYDIPWNPTRVIQRVGRINRIGKKVFDKLYIYNFFPTKKGASVVKSKQIAADKMFMIHRTLGEDSQIFSSDETPSASALYSRVSTKPEESEGESSFTAIRRLLAEVAEQHPEVLEKVEKFAPRVKTAKLAAKDSLVVFTQKGRDLFAQAMFADSEQPIGEVSIEDAIELVKCEFEEQRQPFSSDFWQNYIDVRDYRERHQRATSETSLEKKALNVVNCHLKKHDFPDLESFIAVLREDILEYRTLPINTLRRIANIGEDGTHARKQFTILQLELGPDYLDKLKKKISETQEEVIIGVENQWEE